MYDAYLIRNGKRHPLRVVWHHETRQAPEIVPWQLRNWRRVRYLSQAELAGMVGATQSAVSAWERGAAEPNELNRWRLHRLMKAGATSPTTTPSANS